MQQDNSHQHEKQTQAFQQQQQTNSNSSSNSNPNSDASQVHKSSQSTNRNISVMTTQAINVAPQSTTTTTTQACNNNNNNNNNSSSSSATINRSSYSRSSSVCSGISSADLSECEDSSRALANSSTTTTSTAVRGAAFLLGLPLHPNGNQSNDSCKLAFARKLRRLLSQSMRAPLPLVATLGALIFVLCLLISDGGSQLLAAPTTEVERAERLVAEPQTLEATRQSSVKLLKRQSGDSRRLHFNSEQHAHQLRAADAAAERERDRIVELLLRQATAHQQQQQQQQQQQPLIDASSVVELPTVDADDASLFVDEASLASLRQAAPSYQHQHASHEHHNTDFLQRQQQQLQQQQQQSSGNVFNVAELAPKMLANTRYEHAPIVSGEEEAALTNAADDTMSSQQRSLVGNNVGVGNDEDQQATQAAERPFDVPQVHCNATEDNFERFACPTADTKGRFKCIEDRFFCDGYFDCPNGEDENRQWCMFYKLTLSHIDVLTSTFLSWSRDERRLQHHNAHQQQHHSMMITNKQQQQHQN